MSNPQRRRKDRKKEGKKKKVSNPQRRRKDRKKEGIVFLLLGTEELKINVRLCWSRANLKDVFSFRSIY